MDLNLDNWTVVKKNWLDFQRNRLPQIVDNYWDARIGQATSVDDTTRSWVNDALIQVMDNGGSLTDGIDAVNNAFDSSFSRARNIARTETAMAMSGGRYEAMLDSAMQPEYRQPGEDVSQYPGKMVAYGMWITADDDHVRGLEPKDVYSHAALHGVIVPVGESFASDCELKHPGDPRAPIGHTANCRCCVTPVSQARVDAGVTAGDLKQVGGGYREEGPVQTIGVGGQRALSLYAELELALRSEMETQPLDNF